MGEVNGKWITVNIDDEAIMMIDNAAVEALKPTMDFIIGDVIQNQYIPFDYGTLQNSRYIYTDTKSNNCNVIVEHNTPYANRIYRGDRFNFQTVNNRNARSRWYKEYQENGQEFERVINFYKNKVKQFSERYVE
jgi:hypothetical protein